MKILKAYKTELDPNNKQRGFFKRCAGTARFVFNWGLANWKLQYENGEKPTAYSLRKLFNSIKDEQCPWVREIPYAVMEAAFLDLGNAFKHFFRRVKSGEDKAGYPKFKHRGGKQVFASRGVKVECDRVRLTGIGWVKLKELGYIPADAVRYGTYANGRKRVGCAWCVNSSDDDLIRDEELYPRRCAELRALRRSIGLPSIPAGIAQPMLFETPMCQYAAVHCE